MKQMIAALLLLTTADCFAAESAFTALKDDAKAGQIELAWEYDLDFVLEGDTLAKVKEVKAGEPEALAKKIVDVVTTSDLVSGLEPDQYPAALVCRGIRVIVMTSAAHTKYYTDNECSLL